MCISENVQRLCSCYSFCSCSCCCSFCYMLLLHSSSSSSSSFSSTEAFIYFNSNSIHIGSKSDNRGSLDRNRVYSLHLHVVAKTIEWKHRQQTNSRNSNKTSSAPCLPPSMDGISSTSKRRTLYKINVATVTLFLL